MTATRPAPWSDVVLTCESSERSVVLVSGEDLHGRYSAVTFFSSVTPVIPAGQPA
jgi:hypothetical protein